ncbi:3-isopropylmalate dehydrogenase [Pseudothermotoga thermarum]|uniref:3-isopropylmalate dehydrogenase n=1 Tax=Pseudothermotoga thermarum DSM 5069 TaxID=688269 RepID=F7YWZ6_9THEM|nr:3-isopropylmalate dehydrogenase [Pseudothermotoga thermarum]AEH50588.1 3-isopropylmalate dehydrogenase [Pseudothermotoga thermarum DSM 5069]
MSGFKIAVLPGDGIGPEVVKQGVKVLETIGKLFHHGFEIQFGLIGGAALDEKGVPLPDETWELCQKADAILLGAVGGPKWDDLPSHMRPEKALLKLREGLKLFANIRPVKFYPNLAFSSPLKENLLKGVDLVIVRELTGGLYFGKPKGRFEENGKVYAVDTMYYTYEEIERIAKVAFELARNRKKKVTSVDKANVLETSRLWREVVQKVASRYPDITLEHMYVDNCAMQLVKNPAQFDVILTENTFGDILSDEAAVITGSIGMLPSASLGEGLKGLYEPIHGSAPDIAGMNIANPLGTILSVALLLRYSLRLEKEANAIEDAVEKVIADGFMTKDLYLNNPSAKKLVSTEEMGDIVVEYVKREYHREE